MVFEYGIKTTAHSGFTDITETVREAVAKSGISDGICVIYVPHTTAGITINENADPDVVRDILHTLNKIVPLEAGYKHLEGNSAAHIKAMLTGLSQTVIIKDGRLMLGTWQGIYLCEYDGPRSRRIIIKVL